MSGHIDTSALTDDMQGNSKITAQQLVESSLRIGPGRIVMGDDLQGGSA